MSLTVTPLAPYDGVEIAGDFKLEPLTFGDAPATPEQLHGAINALMLLTIPKRGNPPEKRKRKIGRFFYALCTGEDDALTVAPLCAELARAGWQCLIGAYGAMTKSNFGDLPPGVMLFRRAHVIDAKWLFKAERTGHFTVLAADDFARVAADPLEYRLASYEWSRQLADVVLAPSRESAQVLQELGVEKPEAVKWLQLPVAMQNPPSIKTFEALIRGVVGETPTEEMLARLHDRVDNGPRLAQPHEAPKLTIAEIINRVYALNRFDYMPFDVVTAWGARAHQSEPSDAGFDVLDHRIAKAADYPVQRVERAVWALMPETSKKAHIAA